MGNLPRNSNAIYLLNVVFKEGFFYFITDETTKKTYIMSFTIQDGTFIFVSFPDVSILFTLKDRKSCLDVGSNYLPLLVGSGFLPNITMNQDVIIWELEKCKYHLQGSNP